MKKIIWISSYPKSGNTFLRILLSTYFFSFDGIFNQKFLDKIKEYPRDFFELALENSIEKELVSWDEKYRKISSNNYDYIFLKTHLANVKINNSSRLIKDNFTKCILYIYRDPRNIVTSLSEFFNIKIEQAIEYITKKNNIIFSDHKNLKLSKGFTPILDWESNFLSYEIDAKNIPTVFIKYENLVNNTQSEFVKILKFLKKFINFEINLEKIARILESTKFNNLINIEKNEGFREKTKMGVKMEKTQFFSKGISRNYRELLNFDEQRLITKAFKVTMERLEYK
tara:strand:+ start:135 stop:986 length:852 start_codon:yes stop_codon:yes gene_type:complete